MSYYNAPRPDASMSNKDELKYAGASMGISAAAQGLKAIDPTGISSMIVGAGGNYLLDKAKKREMQALAKRAAQQRGDFESAVAQGGYQGQEIVFAAKGVSNMNNTVEYSGKEYVLNGNNEVVVSPGELVKDPVKGMSSDDTHAEGGKYATKQTFEDIEREKGREPNGDYWVVSEKDSKNMKTYLKNGDTKSIDAIRKFYKVREAKKGLPFVNHAANGAGNIPDDDWESYMEEDKSLGINIGANGSNYKQGLTAGSLDTMPIAPLASVTNLAPTSKNLDPSLSVGEINPNYGTYASGKLTLGTKLDMAGKSIADGYNKVVNSDAAKNISSGLKNNVGYMYGLASVLGGPEQTRYSRYAPQNMKTTDISSKILSDINSQERIAGAGVARNTGNAMQYAMNRSAIGAASQSAKADTRMKQAASNMEVRNANINAANQARMANMQQADKETNADQMARARLQEQRYKLFGDMQQQYKMNQDFEFRNQLAEKQTRANALGSLSTLMGSPQVMANKEAYQPLFDFVKSEYGLDLFSNN